MPPPPAAPSVKDIKGPSLGPPLPKPAAKQHSPAPSAAGGVALPPPRVQAPHLEAAEKVSPQHVLQSGCQHASSRQLLQHAAMAGEHYITPAAWLHVWQECAGLQRDHVDAWQLSACCSAEHQWSFLRQLICVWCACSAACT